MIYESRPEIKFQPVVKSSNVAALAWETTDEGLGILHVAFKSGGIYAYGPMHNEETVPLRKAMEGSESIGTVLQPIIQRSKLSDTDPRRIACVLMTSMPPTFLEAERLALLEQRGN